MTTPTPAVTLDSLAQQIAALAAAVADIRVQLRGPGMAGWPQLGQNAFGQNLTVVDSLAALQQKVGQPGTPGQQGTGSGLLGLLTMLAPLMAGMGKSGGGGGPGGGMDISSMIAIFEQLFSGFGGGG